MKMREGGREEGRLPATLELEEEEGGGGGRGGRRGVGDSLGHEMDRLPDGWSQEAEGSTSEPEMGDRWEVPVGMRACEKREFMTS